MASVTVTAEDLLPDIEELFLTSPAEPRAAPSRPLVGINAALSVAVPDDHDGGGGLVDPSDQVDDTQNAETSKVPGTERLWIRYARS